MAWLILYYSLELFKWLVIVRAVMSWFVSPHSSNPIVEFVRRATDPILRPLSELIPSAGGVDLSPLVAFFGIILIQRLILSVGF